jgi:hypothetical protein
MSQRYLGSTLVQGRARRAGNRRPHADLAGMSGIVATNQSFENLAHDWHTYCFRAGIFWGSRS